MQDYTIDPTSPSFNSRSPFNPSSPSLDGNPNQTKKIITIVLVVVICMVLSPMIIFGVVFFAILFPMMQEGISKIESHSEGIEIPISNTQTLAILKQNYAGGALNIPISKTDCNNLNDYINHQASDAPNFDICKDGKIETYITAASDDKEYIYLLDSTHIARLKLNMTYSKLYEIAIYTERKPEVVEKAKMIDLSESLIPGEADESEESSDGESIDRLPDDVLNMLNH